MNSVRVWRDKRATDKRKRWVVITRYESVVYADRFETRKAADAHARVMRQRVRS